MAGWIALDRMVLIDDELKLECNNFCKATCQGMGGTDCTLKYNIYTGKREETPGCQIQYTKNSTPSCIQLTQNQIDSLGKCSNCCDKIVSGGCQTYNKSSLYDGLFRNLINQNIARDEGVQNLGGYMNPNNQTLA